MEHLTEKWSGKLALIKIFIAAWLLLLLIDSIGFKAYMSTLQGRCLVGHELIIKAIEKHISSGEHIPVNLSELASLEFVSKAERFSIAPTISTLKKRYELKYYPEAWRQPGRIFLQSSVCGSYVVTFGSGSQAVLSHWCYELEENLSDKISLSRDEYRLQARGAYATLPAAVFYTLLILSLFLIVVVERIMKKKKDKSE